MPFRISAAGQVACGVIFVLVSIGVDQQTIECIVLVRKGISEGISEAGLVSITGSEEIPSKAGISIADIAAGMYAYTGILTALLNRSKTGKGTVMEISMLEALGEWMECIDPLMEKERVKQINTKKANR